MRAPRLLSVIAALLLVFGLGALAFLTRDHWLPWLTATSPTADAKDVQPVPPTEAKMLELSAQARKNLSLVSKPVVVQNYWRTIQVPGVIVDRPGVSDRGITAPAVGLVAKVHAFPGDTVKAGDRLFTLRLISEYLQNTQSELFKTKREMQLAQEQRDRLASLAEGGTIAQSKIIEVDSQLRRLAAAVQAYRQDLLTRGLSPTQIDTVADGKFVSEIEVVAPPPVVDDKQPAAILPVNISTSAIANDNLIYEVQELKAELGQQVQAGQLLCILANHQSLYIEGHSFKREAPYLEAAAKNRWPVKVEFSQDPSPLSPLPEGEGKGVRAWPPMDQTFRIRHLANSLDPASRTFDFFLPLQNQSRCYEQDGRKFLVWRFRPGQQVRLHVPVEEFKNVIVLPAAALVRQGPEAYVFVQNGDLFDRHSVHVLHEDRHNVVLAKEGSVKPGWYLAQSAAASLNRVLKAQNASGGLPPGAHFHADGTLHIPGK